MKCNYYNQITNQKNDNLLKAIKLLSSENNILTQKIRKIKKFLNPNLIYNHVKPKRIPQQEELIHSCPLLSCHKKYQRQSYLITHIRFKHSDIYYIPKLKNGRRMLDNPLEINFNVFKIK